MAGIDPKHVGGNQQQNNLVQETTTDASSSCPKRTKAEKKAEKEARTQQKKANKDAKAKPESEKDTYFTGDVKSAGLLPQYRSKRFETETQTFFAPVDGALTKGPLLDEKGEINGEALLCPADFSQNLCDCYFISSLQAVAQTHPGLLESMVTDHGDGTYTVDFNVRLPVLGAFDHKETVNAQFPSSTVLSHIADAAGKRNILVQIIEKAYARWRGSYSDLAWGLPSRALSNFTGAHTTFVFVHAKSEEALYRQIKHALDKGFPTVAGTLDLFSYDTVVEMVEKRAKQINEERVAAGREPIPTSIDEEGFKPRGILSHIIYNRASDTQSFTNRHCYSVVAVNEETENGEVKRAITLRNPRMPADSDLMTVSFAQFQSEFFHLNINHAGSDVRDNTRHKLKKMARRSAITGDKKPSERVVRESEERVKLATDELKPKPQQ